MLFCLTILGYVSSVREQFVLIPSIKMSKQWSYMADINTL